MTTARPEEFKIAVPDATLAAIAQRVAAYRLPSAPTGTGWRYGIDADYLRALVTHWRTAYDWRATERQLNRMHHYRVAIDGQVVHYIHERGSGAHPRALLLLHGWPYSPLSFLDVIEPLAHPERFGGNPDDGFDVIVPDLPGFGWSEAPRELRGLRFAAERMRRLMTDVLGYSRFVIQGGDFGDVVGVWLAFDHPEQVLGLHENQLAFRDADAGFEAGALHAPGTPDERAYMAHELAVLTPEAAYRKIQATRAQTLAAALTDSPVGQAAWIIEKFYQWSDRTQLPFERIFSFDHLLGEAMYYLVTDSFETSIRPYVALAFLDEERGVLPTGAKLTVPVAFAVFPHDAIGPIAPRSLLERSRAHIVQWTEMPRGGHFPMLETPALFVDDLRAFARQLPR